MRFYKKKRTPKESFQFVKKSSESWAFCRIYGKIDTVIEMLEKILNNRALVEIVSLEDLVPEDHLLRKIDAAVDFSKIYEFVEDLYCEDNGRPSIDPVILFKMVLIQHLYGITSLRRVAKEVTKSPVIITITGLFLFVSNHIYCSNLEQCTNKVRMRLFIGYRAYMSSLPDSVKYI